MPGPSGRGRAYSCRFTNRGVIKQSAEISVPNEERPTGPQSAGEQPMGGLPNVQLPPEQGDRNESPGGCDKSLTGNRGAPT
jgi:hypothetical protein